MAEKIQDGVNGFLFKIGDSHHLKEVFQKIVDDPGVLNIVKRNIGTMMIPTVEQEAYAYARIYDQIRKERT